ncbi:MAG: hypothetical protein A2W31_15230 [Planctomycetes bacterium RBG_16_64_10]|nr:MAG: hypothetical protein A2W31_15230 [Planctomycetes bacterium RBG_16_64_10]
MKPFRELLGAVIVALVATASLVLLSGMAADITPVPSEPTPIVARPLTDRLVAWTLYDGDTLTNCQIDLGYGITLTDSVRIIEIDTPEVTGPSAAAGTIVRDRTKVWLASHKELWLIGRGREKYGRILGDVQPVGGGQPLSQWLLKNGYAKPTSDTGKRPVWTPDELQRIVERTE